MGKWRFVLEMLCVHPARILQRIASEDQLLCGLTGERLGTEQLEAGGGSRAHIPLGRGSVVFPACRVGSSKHTPHMPEADVCSHGAACSLGKAPSAVIGA